MSTTTAVIVLLNLAVALAVWHLTDELERSGGEEAQSNGFLAALLVAVMGVVDVIAIAIWFIR